MAVAVIPFNVFVFLCFEQSYGGGTDGIITNCTWLDGVCVAQRMHAEVNRFECVRTRTEFLP